MLTSDSGFITAGDGRVYYEVDGDGPAVVLIHGASVDLRMWAEQVPELSESCRVIRYDLRGLGRSAPPPTAPYRMADDVLAVLDHLGVAAAAIVGFSTGGAIALELAARHPERVTAVALIGAIAPLDPAEMPPAMAAARNDLVELLAPREAASEAGDFTAAVAADLDVWARAHHGEARARLQAWGEDNPYFHTMGEHEQIGPLSAADLASIAAPALIVVGEHDVALSRLAGEHLAAAIPGARLSVFPGADHYVSTGQPAEFSKALRSFLDDCHPGDCVTQN